jgi:uncharacterized RDD family membrane protein YckC
MAASDGFAGRVPRQPLDTTLGIVSPENIAFQFRLAGPAARSVAFLVDLLAVGLMCGLLIMLGEILRVVLDPVGVGFVGEVSAGLGLLGLFFVWWGYGATCEVLASGRTLGKAALGLRVVSQTGLSINPAQAILRNLLRMVDVAPPFFPGVVAIAVTSRLQRLGDLAAGTIVVLDRMHRTPRPPRLETAGADLVPDGFEARPPLVEALAAYVGRRGELSAARRMELAGIAAARLCTAWGRPPPADPDAVVCAVYERAIAAGSGEGR